MTFDGLGLSSGRASGALFVQAPPTFENRRYSPDEWEQARQRALRVIDEKAKIGGVSAEILDAHRMMLEDPELTGFVLAASSESSLLDVLEQAETRFIKPLEQLADDYFNARAQDVREVLDEWSRFLSKSAEDMTRLRHPAIVAGERISTEWFLSQDPDMVRGIVIVHGTSTMHLAIVARNLAIPVIRVAEEVFAKVRQARWVSLDADRGTLEVLSTPTIITNPQEATGVTSEVSRSQVTYQGEKVEVRANVGSNLEVKRAVAFGADGIGLFRTELSFVTGERDVYSVRDHADIYREAVDLMRGLPLTIRALDIGADKTVARVAMAQEPNPQLGKRGIRYLQSNPDIFRAQLEGIRRAGDGRNLELMFPMISEPSEWAFARNTVRDVFRMYDGELSLGVMLEVPCAGLFLPELVTAGLDFISIGTNDLTQYLVARDREADWNLKSEILPVLRFMHMVLSSVRVRVSVCGELGGNPLLTPLLLAMGVREFSVSLPMIVPVKNRIAQCRDVDPQSVLSLLWECHSDEELLHRLKGIT